MQLDATRKKVDELHRQLRQAQAAMHDGVASDAQALAQLETLSALHDNAQLELEALQEPVTLFGAAPYIAIWDSHVGAGADGCTQLRRIDFPPESSPPVSARCARNGLVLHAHHGMCQERAAR